MDNFVIRPLATGLKFDLKANNGETVATSEVYKTESGCHRGIASVQANIRAPLEDLTDPNGDRFANPKFQLYQDKGGHFRFRLRSRNGKILLFSQSYRTKAACLAGIQSVRANANENNP